MNNYELLQEKNNLIEHLRITTKNLQIVNEELSASLSEKKKVYEDLEDVRNVLSHTITELQEVNRVLNENRNIADRIIGEAETIKVKATKILKEHEDKAIELSEKNKKSEELFAFNKQEKQKEIDSLNTVEASIKDSINFLKIKESNLTDSITKLDKENRILTDEQVSLKEKNETLSKELQTRQLSFNVKMAELDKLISIEKDKVSIPMQMLDLREKEVSKKENNLLILSTRFKQKFEKVFPGQNINLN